jgi:multiple RNA-binding domain-containing protein 1
VEEQNHRTSHLSSFQKKKEDERRKMANKREGWNASYVRSDTVIDSLSDKWVKSHSSLCISFHHCSIRYGISRGDILDTDGVGGGELAVRLAIGETQVIQENKEYFSSHGVDFDSLESALSSSKSKSSKPTERSTTTLLIKNLPHDVVGEELEEMFAKYAVPPPALFLLFSSSSFLSFDSLSK